MKRFFLLFIFLNLTFFVKAQPNIELERSLILKVKQFNEFVNRFNYTTDFKGNPIDSSFSQIFPKPEYLNLLFNLSDSRFIVDSQNYSKAYRVQVDSFISLVDAENIQLNYNSDKVIAEAFAVIIRGNIEENISIFLKKGNLGHGMYKWVIHDIYSSKYLFEYEDSAQNKFLSPVSNETNFIALHRALSNKNQLLHYTYGGFMLDNLSIFLYELYKGDIKFKHVKKVKYHVYAMDGWEFTVEEFNRNSNNSGWLISNLNPVEP